MAFNRAQHDLIPESSVFISTPSLSLKCRWLQLMTSLATEKWRTKGSAPRRLPRWCFSAGESERSVTGGDLRNRCSGAGSRCLFPWRTQGWRELWLQIW
jgi:hypothetical protein